MLSKFRRKGVAVKMHPWKSYATKPQFPTKALQKLESENPLSITHL
jgi:hypothetical protein